MCFWKGLLSKGSVRPNHLPKRRQEMMNGKNPNYDHEHHEHHRHSHSWWIWSSVALLILLSSFVVGYVAF